MVPCEFGLGGLWQKTFSSLLFGLIFVLSGGARSEVIHVPADFPAIVDAVTFASEGDTVMVAKGTYNECGIFLKDAMRLQGAGIDCSTIRADGCPRYSWIVFGAPAAQIEGFTLIGQADSMTIGIFDWTSPMLIRRNKITTCYQPIAVATSSVICDNIIVDNYGYGIFCGNPTYAPTEIGPTITDNLIAGCFDQAIVSVSSSITAVNNTLDGSSAGIWLQGDSAIPSPTVTAINNVMSNNNYGIYISHWAEFAVDTSLVTMGFNDVWNNLWADCEGWAPDSTDLSADPLYVTYPAGASHSPRGLPSELAELTRQNELVNDLNSALANGNPVTFRQFSEPMSRGAALADSFDFNLKPESPCVDSGHPDPQFDDPNGTRNDIGALPLLDCGDADASGQVDVSDAVHIINWIFGDCRQPPQSLDRSDSDCSDRTDISDAVYLISFIFGGGPGPCVACP